MQFRLTQHHHNQHLSVKNSTFLASLWVFLYGLHWITLVSLIKNLFLISAQEADLAIAPLTLTAAREKAVAMSKPFMQTGISVLLRRDISEREGFFDFLTPFSAMTWLGILVAYLGTAACIFIAARLVRQLV